MEHGVAGIAGIDTRRLTRHIRDTGAMPGAFGTADEATLRAAAVAEPGTDGLDMAATVTCDSPYSVASARADNKAPWNMIAVDFGIKSTILDQLALLGGVTVVPASTAAATILEHKPDGVFLSNGPGDPEGVVGATRDDRWSSGRGTGLRYLPGPPAAFTHAWFTCLQAAVWASRWQSSRA